MALYIHLSAEVCHHLKIAF